MKKLTATNLGPPLAVMPLLLAACGQASPDPRGVDRSETLLSVSATGHAEARPDKAEFQAGIQTWAKSAKDASSANAKKIGEIVASLAKLGIEEKDIQTRAVSVDRIEWGDRKGQFQAVNTVNVTVRDVDKAGAAVTAATEAGANIVNGPNLTMSDPEATANLAYANAYKAARRRAEAYAKAAGMKVSRILYIRDAGGSQGTRYLPAAEAAARVEAAPPAVSLQAAPPPPPRPEQGGARIMAGQTASDVSIQVDFALQQQ